MAKLFADRAVITINGEPIEIVGNPTLVMNIEEEQRAEILRAYGLTAEELTWEQNLTATMVMEARSDESVDLAVEHVRLTSVKTFNRWVHKKMKQRAQEKARRRKARFRRKRRLRRLGRL